MLHEQVYFPRGKFVKGLEAADIPAMAPAGEQYRLSSISCADKFFDPLSAQQI